MAEIDVSGDITLAAGNCTVGFVDSEANPPRPLGSGTLVSFGKLRGILTCAHVLEALSRRKQFGVVVFCRGPAKPQGLRVLTDQCEMIAMSGAEWSSAGPDIGFLILPYNDASWLASFASITNGDNRRRDFLRQEPQCDISFFSVLGGVAEWTSATVDNEVLTITQFNALSNIGRISQADGAEGFDFVEFDATPEQSFQLPGTYQGVSGGGLWKFYFRETADGLALIEARLLGVAFFETQHGTIVCHGPRSIYEQLYSRLPVEKAAA